MQITVAPEPKMLKVVAQILPEQSETTLILKKALGEYGREGPPLTSVHIRPPAKNY